jgi:hypothetical protein
MSPSSGLLVHITKEFSNHDRYLLLGDLQTFLLEVPIGFRYTDSMKNKASHWILLGALSLANATVWFLFFQQIDILVNH